MEGILLCISFPDNENEVRFTVKDGKLFISTINTKFEDLEKIKQMMLLVHNNLT